MSPQAFQTIAAEIKGLNDYKIAKAAAAGGFTGNPNQFEGTWNQLITPTAFVLRHMPHADVAQFAKQLGGSPEGRAAAAQLSAEVKLLDVHGIYGLTVGSPR